MKQNKYNIFSKDKKNTKEVKQALDLWYETAILCPDNIRYQENYVPEYLGMLKTFDALLWTTSITKFITVSNILDYLKIKYFPDWLLYRFPVKLCIIDIKILYPEISKFPNKARLQDWNKSKKFIRVDKRDETMRSLDIFIEITKDSN